jgi:septum formation inhibitor-activating ATPase MinD
LCKSAVDIDITKNGIAVVVDAERNIVDDFVDVVSEKVDFPTECLMG